jgi:hypothetical protein
MKVRGTVTRVVEGQGGGPASVFFRPADNAAYAQVASAHLTASGEMVAPIEGDELEVGDEAEFEVAGGDEPPKAAQAAEEAKAAGDDDTKG